MNKIEQIKAEIERLMNEEWKWGSSTEAKFRCEAYKELLEFIDSLPEEESSKDLEEAAKEYENKLGYYECMNQWPSVSFIAGSKWNQERMTDKACRWWEKEFGYPTLTEGERKWYEEKVRDFRKAMEDKI